jgi:hypothetical protein
MTSDDRIDKLETRVDRLEDRIATDITKIFEKLDALTNSVNVNALRAAKAECPNPGACVQLSNDLTHTVKLLTAQTERVERLELKMLEFDRARVESDKINILAMQGVKEEFHKIDKQRAWVLGVWSAIAFFASVIGAVLTVIISHYLDKL